MGFRRRHRRSFNRANLCHFKRSQFLEEITVTGTAVSKAYTIQLSTLPGVTDFVNMFQAYRLNKVVFKLIPSQNVATGATANTNGVPTIVDAIDFNDNNAGGTEAQLLESSYARLHRGFFPVKRKFTPACEVALNGAVVGTAVVGIQKFKQWIDMAVNDCQHYGWKVTITPNTGNTFQYKYRLYRTLYFSCKQLQ